MEINDVGSSREIAAILIPNRDIQFPMLSIMTM